MNLDLARMQIVRYLKTNSQTKKKINLNLETKKAYNSKKKTN